MIFVVSGEGPSDIGRCNGPCNECSGDDFIRGTMAVVVERLVGHILRFTRQQLFTLVFVSEARRLEITRSLPKSLVIGKKRGFEGAYFFKEARALAKLAKEKSTSEGCPVAAVLFRDTDGTRTTERGLFEVKWKSIEDGFKAADFELGVPMVPNPKSEAWLLCALQANPYQNCASLEASLSGNDNAPNSAKLQLEARLVERGNMVIDLPDMVNDGTIDPTRITMPSFCRFRNRLEAVAREMIGQPPPR